jgi:prophage tail gpP-like protein
MSDILLEVEGTAYSGFTDISVTKNIENLSGEFTFSSTEPEKINNIPLKNGAVARVLINGIPVITGFIDPIINNIDISTHSISVSGRDKTSDIIDSSAPLGLNIQSNISLKSVIEKTLIASGNSNVKVIDKVGNLENFSKNDIIQVSVGETIFQFLEKYARKRQVLLNSDGDGNIVIDRASTISTDTKLFFYDGDKEKQNNVKFASPVFDDTGRFYKITMVSQGSPNSGSKYNPSDLVMSKGIAYDNEIRKSKQLIILSENTMNKKTLTNRAKWEVNVRRARSIVWNGTVQDVIDSNGNIWMPNTLVEIIDEVNKINAEMLIKSVTYGLSLTTGTTTLLSCVSSDAYTLQASIDELDARYNKKGRD